MTTTTFDNLGLIPSVLKAVNDAGYEAPSPIQIECIPLIMENRDVLGQAQTGTGKTAAFALPLLSKINIKLKTPQVLVLTPTRELAIQVAESFQSYAQKMKGFHVLPIYGGSPYANQLRQLKHGAHVIVGTPGRTMDHISRGTLNLDGLKTLVLDEADEMLRMGFIDDVEWILERLPKERQIALFSATMPDVIRKVAKRYLNKPAEIKIAAKTSTAKNIRQRFWLVTGVHKLDALTRILELETFDAVIVFVRTKTATVELAQKLAARGHACEPLNGDIQQSSREKTVDRLRKGKLDILVATDVVARGLDVERISHVINYDIPYDTESYVHRIGRTGRAGRDGDAILFVSPREQRLLRGIERSTKQKITPMQLPTASDINKIRIERFKKRITESIANSQSEFYYQMLTEIMQEQEAEPLEIAAALAILLQGDEPLLLSEKPISKSRTRRNESHDSDDRGSQPRKPPRQSQESKLENFSDEAGTLREFPDIRMQRFRVEVGSSRGIKPGNLVGAIANEADIDSCFIGDINIFENFSTVDLPEDIPKSSLGVLKKTRVGGNPLAIRAFSLIDVNTQEKSTRKKPSAKPRNTANKKPATKTSPAKRKPKKTRKKTD